jgi:lysophospholipase L1-like esterase
MNMRIKKIIFTLIPCVILIFILEISLRSIYYQISQRTHEHTFAIGQAVDDVRNWVNNLGVTIDNIEDLHSYILHREQIEEQFPLFLENRVAFGNTPFKELLTTDNQTLIKNENGFLINRPNDKFYTGFLRSLIFKEWDPIVIKQFAEYRQKDVGIEKFIQQYCLSLQKVTIEESGSRLTIPKSNANCIVLVIGDSVAFGSLLNDEDTLASQLQTQLPNLKFVNAGVARAGARDNAQQLARRLQEFGHRVVAVIYVHCENDFSKQDTPDTIVSGIVDVLNAHDIKTRIFVYQQYIYRTMPDLLRPENPKLLKGFFDLKRETIRLAKRNQFQVVDFYDLVDAYRRELGTPLAGFGLYVDHAHFSKLGTKHVADKILPYLTNLSNKLE